MKIPVLLMARELTFGGSERQMTETAKSLDRSRFEPHIGCFIATGMRGDELRRTGIPMVQFPVTSFRSFGAISQARHMARYIRDHNIRLVHTWDYPLNVYAMPIVRMMTSAVAVSSQRSSRRLIPPGYQKLMPMSDRASHAVVVNCEYLRRHLIDDERVTAAKIHVCYNGIDCDHFERLPAAPHPLTIGTLCGLRPEKDLPTLVEAFALSRDLMPEIKLVFVGSGDQLPLLERRVQEHGLQDACHFETATAQVREWLSAIDIFVLPSRSEALSNSLMEAMSCGCCCVASKVGGNPELIAHGETGLLFDAGNSQSLAECLRSLIADPELRSRLAGNGARLIREKFSIATAAERMGQIYERLIGERASK